MIFSKRLIPLIFLALLALPRLPAQDEPTTEKATTETAVESFKDLAATANKAKAEYDALAKRAPEELAEIARQLEIPLPVVDPDAAPNVTLEAAQAKLAEVTADLKTEEATALALAEKDKQRLLREGQIPGELAAARNELAEFQASGEGENLAKRELLTSIIAKLEAEQATFTVRGDLLVQKTRLANRKIANLTANKATWQKIYDTLKTATTAAATDLAKDRAEAFAKIPALAKLTTESAGLAKAREKIAELTSETTAEEARIAALRKAVREQSDAATERLDLLEKAGLRIDSKNGRLLRQQRAELPTATDLTTQLHDTIRQSTTARLQRAELKKRFENLPPDQTSQVGEILQTIDDPKITRGEVAELVSQHHQFFSDLLRDYDAYISSLQALSTDTQLAVTEVGTYSRYLDERLLWIPSASRISQRDLSIEVASIRDFSKTILQKWTPVIVADFKSHPLLWIVTFLLALTLILKKGALKKHLAASAIKARQRNCITIKPTLLALALTTLLVLPLPLIFGFLAWRGSSIIDVQTALSAVAGFLFFVGLFRAMVRKDGFLPAHLNMSPSRAHHLASHFRWIYPINPLFLFLATALLINPLHPESGRISFLLLMLFTIIAFHCLLRPKKELVFSKEDTPWKAKTLYGIGVLIPILFAIGFAMGYLSSVNTLRLQTLGSIWLILGCVFLGAFLIRWTLVSRRRLARDLARKKFDTEVEARERIEAEKTEAESEKTSPSDHPKFEEMEAQVIDVVKVEEQTTSLIRLGVIVLIAIGLWNIWQTSLPALSALDKVTLWSSAETSEVVSPASDVTKALTGQSSEVEYETVETVPAHRLSLQDLLQSILIIVLTLTAARNLPGLLELTLLRRLSLREGGTYAITTTFRYLITLLGFLVAFGIIGITWSSMKWLAAAVTLGIGFGLQEIFANFVAGIILLYERPIRVGDTVTVGNETGKVTKIEIRATTIMKFNRRELIIPNKKFIIGELTNWTLSSREQRFDFAVGITHGSKSREALAIFERLLKAHPDIMDEPEPSAYFTDFAPGCLEFQIRGYVPDTDHLLRVKSELRFQIEEALEEAGIGIAFPQTDRNIIAHSSDNSSPETEANNH